jgi:hypothetical protein
MEVLVCAVIDNEVNSTAAATTMDFMFLSFLSLLKSRKGTLIR